MKRFLVAVLSVFMVAFSANAGKMRADGMTMVKQGAFTLGLGIGTPGWSMRAVMPMITIDGDWGLADGFIKTKKFGQNGAVDLGFQYGICGYKEYKYWGNCHHVGDKWYTGSALENMILIRSAFHFQFVKKLDTYAGINGGVSISSPVGDHEVCVEERWDHLSAIFGMYCGGKWYFTDVFGVKLEFESDWIDGSQTPAVSIGCTWKF